MPFMTEELWALSGDRAKMLVHANWPEYTAADLLDPAAAAEMGWAISLIEGVRSARAQLRVPVGLYVPMLHTGLSDAAAGAWARNEALITRLARIESLTTAETMPKGTLTVATEGATFGIPLEGLIDIAAEKDRLSKALDKLSKELGGLRGRLNNPKFVESAPEDVVDETREMLATKEDEEAQLRQALDRLAEVV
jgi:valyl-tRNA synthetase